MNAPHGKTALEEYLDDLWETCEFPRPKQPSEAMKSARLRASYETEDRLKSHPSNENMNGDEYVDQLDARHYRNVTDEIRKIRGERASDKNIEWILGRREVTPPQSLKKTNVESNLNATNQSMPILKYAPMNDSYELNINVHNLLEFPELK